MVEAWILAIFCLVIGIPIGISERRQYGRAKYAERNISSRVQYFQR